MLRWGQAARQVIVPRNPRTAESFPIAGELYAWCSAVTADDLAPGSVLRFWALSFGYGPHGCAGQGLARLEVHAVIDALVRKARRLAVGDELRVPSVSPSG